MPDRFWKLLVTLLTLGCLAVVVGACGDDEDSGSSSEGTGAETTAAVPGKPEAGTFRMGIEPWLGYGPWRIAEDQGLFEENGLDVKITNFTTDDQINAAFASGKLEGTNIATHTALRFAASGLPIKIVLLEDLSTTADAIVASSGVTSITDLKGKKVAFEEGTTSDILLSYALAKNGMSKDDIQPVPIPAADAGSAFIAGRVDAAVTYEPYLTAALKQDKDAKLLYTAGENPGLVGDVFVVSEDTLNEKPGQIAALVKTWDAALDAYEADKPGSQAIIEKSVGAKPGDLKTAFDGVKFYGLAENKTQLSGEYVTKTIEDVKQAATDAGLLEGDVDPKDIIVAKFVEQAG
jgi:NitT/TauT family transport system substrate-binding protein